MLLVTSVYAAVGALFAATLALNVVRLRRRHRIGLHDGGHRDLALAIRAHANLLESLPLVLVLLALLEMAHVDAWWLHLAGVAYFAGRVLHAVTLVRTDEARPGRTIGTTLTITALVLGAGALLGLAVGA